MLIRKFLLLALALINLFNLSACSSIAEDIVPKNGPTMEQIYDGMGNPNTPLYVEEKERCS